MLSATGDCGEFITGYLQSGGGATASEHKAVSLHRYMQLCLSNSVDVSLLGSLTAVYTHACSTCNTGKHHTLLVFTVGECVL